LKQCFYTYTYIHIFKARPNFCHKNQAPFKKKHLDLVVNGLQSYFRLMKLKIELFNRIIEFCRSQSSYKNNSIELPKIMKKKKSKQTISGISFKERISAFINVSNFT